MDDSNMVVTDQNLKETIKKLEQFYIDYALKNWVEKYPAMKSLQNELQMPSIVVEISDMPHGSSDYRSSKVEKSTLKRVYAEEWIEIFHNKLSDMEELQREIIEKKYLNTKSGGRYYTDDEIYPTLYINRTLYYEMKRKALVTLGSKLYGKFYTNEQIK